MHALALALLVSLPPASLQAVPDVTNPSAVQFTASTDHDRVDYYELDILRPDNSVLQTLNIGKPVPDSAQTCLAPVNVQPIAFGTGYAMQLRAVAGGAMSGNTLSENKFNRAPGGPTRVIIRPPGPEE